MNAKLPTSARVTAIALTGLIVAAAAQAQIGPGDALSLDGTSQYVSATIPTLAENYTVSAWVFLRAGGNLGVLSGMYCDDSTIEFLIHGDNFNASDPQVLELGRCNDFGGAPSTNYVPTNQWVHVAVTVSSTKQVSYFINGAAVGAWDASSHNLTLGPNIHLADNNTRHFNGLLDEVQIWSIARPQADIQAGMNRPLIGNEAGLLANWRFDEGSGTTALNSAMAGGSACNGTLVASPLFVVSGIPFVPSAITGAAIHIGLTNATLIASVNPGNLSSTAWFEWGATTNYGNTTAVTSLPATNSTLVTSANLTNLALGQTYHFHIVATNTGGAALGSDMQFTTRTGTNTVTTLADSGPGSLRQAIADSISGGTVLFATNGTIILTLGELLITNSLTLTGPGMTNLAISGNNSNRVFNIASNVIVAISDLTICNGKAADGAIGAPGANGGGIYSLGDLSLTRCAIMTNAAGAGGRGSDGTGFSAGGKGGNGGNGGGVYGSGPLTLNNCIFNGNAAGIGGTGGSPPPACAGCNAGDGGNGGSGGGVWCSDTLRVVGCTFSGNTAASGGNAKEGDVGGAGATGGSGGGVWCSGTLSLSASTFNGNAAGCGGDGGASGIGSDGGAGGAGGAGGGVWCSGTFSLSFSTFSGNVAGDGGSGGGGHGVIGGVGNGNGGPGGAGGTGGGVWCSGVLSLSLSTFNGNAAGNGGPGSGGISVAGFPVNGGNGGPGGAGGGVGSSGPISLCSCTLSSNTSGAGGAGGRASPFGGLAGLPGTGGTGGGFYATINAASATLRNSLLAHNTASLGPDLFGAFTSLGHNLLGQTDGSLGLVNGVNGDLVGTASAPLDPLLGPLADNGGPTFTMALLPYSPALNAGDQTLTGTDQRGFPRLAGPLVDIGAFESGVTTSSPIVSPGTVAFTTQLDGSVTAIFTAMVNPNGPITAWHINYGFTTGYGAASAPVSIGGGTNTILTNVVQTWLAPGVTYHYRVAAISAGGVTFGPDQTFTTALILPPGDLNGDGVVDQADLALLVHNLHGNGVVSQSDLSLVLSNYWPSSPWLQMTNAAGLGSPNVSFALTNSTAGTFSIEVSTNLVDWHLLGTATPRYEFNDSSAPSGPGRFYRLRWP